MKRSPIRRSTMRREMTARRTLRVEAKRDRATVMAEARAAMIERDGDVCRLAFTELDGHDFPECAGLLHAHHIKTRARGGLDASSNLVGVCGAHHGWVHGHPIPAYQLGLLAHAQDDEWAHWLRMCAAGLADMPVPSRRSFPDDLTDVRCDCCGTRGVDGVCRSCEIGFVKGSEL